MREPTLHRTFAAAVAAMAWVAALGSIDAGTAAAAPPDAGGETRVPLTTSLRACDFSFLLNKPFWGAMHAGQGEAAIRTSGNTVVAEVQFVNTRRPGTHYDVGLIQVPRPTSSPCGPGDPGTAFTGMDIDAAGRATVALHDTIRPGTTGVWVEVQRPSPHSQDPVEFYTSSFLAQV